MRAFLAVCALVLAPGYLLAQTPVGGGVGGSADPVRTENALFDANRTERIALLRKLYEEHQILALGEMSHANVSMYATVLELLQQIGTDPRLKYIVAERGVLDQGPLYEELSITDVDEAGLQQLLPSSLIKRICSKWISYDVGRFLPQIRRINARRPAAHPIRFAGVDAWHLGSYTEEGKGPYSIRELGTAARFATRFWDSLGPADKVIVLYHATHVSKVPVDRFDNWFSIFLRQHPEAVPHVAVAALDFNETNAGGGGMEGYSWFAYRQQARYPGQMWGVPLAPFRNSGATVATERDKHRHDDNDPYPSDSATPVLPDAFDAVLWLPSVEARREPGAYLPGLCGGQLPPRSKEPFAPKPVLDLLEAERMRVEGGYALSQLMPREVAETTSVVRTWLHHAFDSLRQARPEVRVPRTP